MIQESSPRSIAYMAHVVNGKRWRHNKRQKLEKPAKKRSAPMCIARAHKQRGEIAQARSIWRNLKVYLKMDFWGKLSRRIVLLNPFQILVLQKKKGIWVGRDTHCWNCKTGLNSEEHSKCNVCGWMICPIAVLVAVDTVDNKRIIAAALA